MGPQKYKNEQISVGHFCGKRAVGAKKTEMRPFLYVAIKKSQTYGTVHAFRSAV